MDRFAQILYDLGQELGLDLFPDTNMICEINYQDTLHIQIEFDEVEDRVVIDTFVCEVPAGKFREKLLHAGLIYNNDENNAGTFAYCESNNMLAFFEYLPAANLSGEAFAKTFQKFIDTAMEWKTSVEKGKPLPIRPPTGEDHESIFGIKR